jgi:protease I
MSMARIDLNGMKVAILVANNFEQTEMTEPRIALKDAGAETMIVSPTTDLRISGMHVVHGAKDNMVQGVHHDEKGDSFRVDMPLDEADSNYFGALLLPGGVMNPDQLRVIDKALQFVREFDEMGKPIAVICHGAWTLVSAGILKGRTLTSWPTLQDDIRNAGAHWVDQQVVVDDNLISSRSPADIHAFNEAMIRLFSEGLKPRKELRPAQAM